MRIICTVAAVALAAGVTVLASGCGAPEGYKPIESGKVLLWDRQTEQSADLLQGLVADFNQQAPGIPVEAQYSGGYTEIFQKVSASIQARTVPAMAVAYESMTAEYIQADAVAELDSFIQAPQTGFSKEDWEDFFPVVISTNVYSAFGGKMYSFPFSKSVLMLYFNKKVLAQAGIAEPPKTWDEFVQQCKQVHERTGGYAYAISVDASTIDGMIYSLGGELVKGNTTCFDSIEAFRTFEILETLIRDQSGYMIPKGSYDDREAFAQDKVAFSIRSSSGIPFAKQAMAGRMDQWGVAPIPQGDPTKPVTVLFGPNLCIFNTTPEQQQRAWAFLKYFTSPETNVRWALGTGYVPIRKSAAQDPRIQEFWREWAYNRTPFDCLDFARAEPNLPGWQEVRNLIEKVETGVLTGQLTAAQAVQELKQGADAILLRAAQ